MKRDACHLWGCSAALLFALVPTAVAQQAISTHGSAYHRTGYRQLPEHARQDRLHEIPRSLLTPPTNYDIILPQFAKPQIERSRILKSTILPPVPINPSVLIWRETGDPRPPQLLIEKPRFDRPEFDFNLHVHRDIDFRVDRLQQAGTCAYCKTGLRGPHSKHTDPSVLFYEDPKEIIRPVPEQVRDQIPAYELYNRQLTNRFDRIMPQPIRQYDRGT